jgi:hypothetical protein
MKKFLVAGSLWIAAPLALAGWFFCAPYILLPKVEVKDVRQPETLVLGEETGNPHTHGIYIRGSGEVVGDATITLLLGGKPYKVAQLSGKVDFEWGGDWYSETAEARYEPGDVQSGKVVIYYRFYK